ncbi:MAG: antitoxin MazE family protein [bacterium]|nr:antitoxin MazE family protein [bacterium]
MATPEKHTSSAGRVRRYRQKMQEQGMRPIQIWVTDVRAPDFSAEAHRQSAAVAAVAHAGDDQAFIDALGLDDA